MKDDKDTGEIIRAAGGLLWRDSAAGEGPKLAVIRRSRYAYEGFTLPKGKLKRGENWRDGALREVEEETGCRAELQAFVGCNSYEVDGKLKLVLYWNMKLVDEGQNVDASEVMELRWMTPEEAIENLHYPSERALVWVSAQSCLISRPTAADSPES